MTSHSSFYVAPNSKRNQFRPYFKDKTTILSNPGRKVDLRQVGKHERPAPTTSPSTKKRKRQKKKEVKRQRRQQRQPSRQLQETGKERNLQSATVMDHRLRKFHVTKTLTVGCIQGNVRRTLRDRLLHGITVANATSAISDRLRSCTKILNQLRIHAYEIIALDIATLLQGRYQVGPVQQTSILTSSSTQGELTSSSSPQAIPPLPQQAQEDLEDLLTNNGFYYSLATLLCTGSLGRQSEYERNVNAPERRMATRHTPLGTPRAQPAVPHAKRAFDRYKQLTQFVPFDQQVSHMFRGTVPRLTMLAVKYAIRAHYLGTKVEDLICDYNNLSAVFCLACALN